MSKRWSKTFSRRMVRRLMKHSNLASCGNRRVYSMHWGEGIGRSDYRYIIRDAEREFKDCQNDRD